MKSSGRGPWGRRIGHQGSPAVHWHLQSFCRKSTGARAARAAIFKRIASLHGHGLLMSAVLMAPPLFLGLQRLQLGAEPLSPRPTRHRLALLRPRCRPSSKFLVPEKPRRVGVGFCAGHFGLRLISSKCAKAPRKLPPQAHAPNLSCERHNRRSLQAASDTQSTAVLRRDATPDQKKHSGSESETASAAASSDS